MATAFHTFELHLARAQGASRLKGGAPSKGRVASQKAAARKSHGGKAPRKQLAAQAVRREALAAQQSSDSEENEDEDEDEDEDEEGREFWIPPRSSDGVSSVAEDWDYRVER